MLETPCFILAINMFKLFQSYMGLQVMHWLPFYIQITFTSMIILDFSNALSSQWRKINYFRYLHSEIGCYPVKEMKMYTYRKD